jgi:hypothetical protein
MRRFIRQTLGLLVLSAALLVRHSNSGSNPGNPNQGDFQVVDPTATGGQRTVTGILEYSGGQFHAGRVREVRTGSTTPRDRKTNDNDNDWSQQDPKHQPQYGDLDQHGRATGMSITMNWQVREDMRQETDPTRAKDIPPGMVGKMNKGHLLGAQFGGSNFDARNFTPLYRPVNSPTMLGVENQVRDYMKANPNEDVTYSVTPNYPPDNADGTPNYIPESVTITLTDSNGNPIQLEHPKGNKVDVVTIDNKKP